MAEKKKPQGEDATVMVQVDEHTHILISQEKYDSICETAEVLADCDVVAAIKESARQGGPKERHSLAAVKRKLGL